MIVVENAGLKGRWPGRYRVVPQIPDGSPWSAH